MVVLMHVLLWAHPIVITGVKTAVCGLAIITVYQVFISHNLRRYLLTFDNKADIFRLIIK